MVLQGFGVYMPAWADIRLLIYKYIYVYVHTFSSSLLLFLRALTRTSRTLTIYLQIIVQNAMLCTRAVILDQETWSVRLYSVHIYAHN